MLPPNWGTGWDHVWLGSTFENMVEAKCRIPAVIRVPAFLRFLSCEPLLEPPDLRRWLGKGMIGWVICGGESGPHRRDMADVWARSLRHSAGSVRRGGRAILHEPDDRQDLGGGEQLIPPDLIVREFPVAA
jgi:protein gp37